MFVRNIILWHFCSRQKHETAKLKHWQSSTHSSRILRWVLTASLWFSNRGSDSFEVTSKPIDGIISSAKRLPLYVRSATCWVDMLSYSVLGVIFRTILQSRYYCWGVSFDPQATCCLFALRLLLMLFFSIFFLLTLHKVVHSWPHDTFLLKKDACKHELCYNQFEIALFTLMKRNL